ncbi:hypothetical protein SLNSH_10450 [Alsobacter soli]|uniref:Flagellin N-terminal domain-containing protein n=1 Tax=Alsobacter soli TaxID=2109933 RepID=A0A2T1HU92_9HYPH|nr:hypothetical protein [Alsobacter soli]PSC05222.1 hypothetical protein SLNSH_10450 [Alsobacter soli]
MTISISDTMRSSLVALATVNTDLTVSQSRLATGKKVNSAADGAAVYFQAQSMTDRAASLDKTNSQMALGLKSISAGVEALSSMKKVMDVQLDSMKNALTGSTAQRKAAADAFRTVLSQVNSYVNDANVLGQGNILKGAAITFKLNEDGSSTQDIKLSSAMDAKSLGFGFDATGKSTDASGNFATDVELNAAITKMTAALDAVNTASMSLSYQNSVVSARADFNKSMLSVLKDGADTLTAADVNEEAAKVGAAQTRQSFVLNGLSITRQSEQSLLQLMR